MKYSLALVKTAEEWVRQHGLIDYGGGQLQDFIKVLGIDDKTYRRWMIEKEEFKTAIERAKDDYKKTLTHDLHETLAMAAKGYEKEVTETEYRPNPKDDSKPIITKMKRKRLIFEPNVGAAIFLITNLDPEHYQNRQNIAAALKSSDEREMTEDEINAEIERFEKLEKKE
jgi:hypothetical protein